MLYVLIFAVGVIVGVIGDSRLGASEVHQIKAELVALEHRLGQKISSHLPKL